LKHENRNQLASETSKNSPGRWQDVWFYTQTLDRHLLCILLVLTGSKSFWKRMSSSPPRVSVMNHTTRTDTYS